MGTAFIGYEHSLRWLNKKRMLGFEMLYMGKVGKRLELSKKGDEEKVAHKKDSIGGARAQHWVNWVPEGEDEIKYIRENGEGEQKMSEELRKAIKGLGINPAYIYERLELEETRGRIRKDTRGLSGVYMIYNKITEDYYVGSGSTNRIYARFSNHLIYYRGSKIVKLVVKKYGIENLAFMVLEIFPEEVNRENNKRLIDLEDKYLKELLPNYNILTEAGSSFGYKHTEMDRKKMREIKSEERRERIGRLNGGRKFSRETIERMKEAARLRPKMKEEKKQRCMTNRRPVVVYNLNGTIYGEYGKVLEAARATNSDEKTVRRALKTKKRILKRKWRVEDAKK